MTSVVQLFSSAGALVLDANTGPYRTVALPDRSRVWVQEWAESAWADGADLAAPERLGLVTKEFRTRIRAASWPQVEAAYEALVGALEPASSSGWKVVTGKGGVLRTWRCAGKASSSAPDSAADVPNRMLLVTWSVPAQPTAGISGLPGA